MNKAALFRAPAFSILDEAEKAIRHDDYPALVSISRQIVDKSLRANSYMAEPLILIVEHLAKNPQYIAVAIDILEHVTFLVSSDTPHKRRIMEVIMAMAQRLPRIQERVRVFSRLADRIDGDVQIKQQAAAHMVGYARAMHRNGQKDNLLIAVHAAEPGSLVERRAIRHLDKYLKTMMLDERISLLGRQAKCARVGSFFERYTVQAFVVNVNLLPNIHKRIEVFKKECGESRHPFLKKQAIKGFTESLVQLPEPLDRVTVLEKIIIDCTNYSSDFKNYAIKALIMNTAQLPQLDLRLRFLESTLPCVNSRDGDVAQLIAAEYIKNVGQSPYPAERFKRLKAAAVHSNDCVAQQMIIKALIKNVEQLPEIVGRVSYFSELCKNHDLGYMHTPSSPKPSIASSSRTLVAAAFYRSVMGLSSVTERIREFRTGVSYYFEREFREQSAAGLFVSIRGLPRTSDRLKVLEELMGDNNVDSLIRTQAEKEIEKFEEQKVSKTPSSLQAARFVKKMLSLG